MPSPKSSSNPDHSIVQDRTPSVAAPYTSPDPNLSSPVECCPSCHPPVPDNSPTLRPSPRVRGTHPCHPPTSAPHPSSGLAVSSDLRIAEADRNHCPCCE